MNSRAFFMDFCQVLLSKRMAYALAIMTLFALVFAAVVRFSPDDLRSALEAAVPPGSAGVFEFIWFEDVMKFLLLVVVSFGAFVTSDLEEDGAICLALARSVSRHEFLVRRIVAAAASLILVFTIGSLLSGAVALAVIGDLDIILFLGHHLMLTPMLLFVFALTFFLAVPLRITTPTVLAGFAIPLMLSIAHTFSSMGNPGAEPTILNPMSFGTRVITGQPLMPAMLVLAILTAILFAAGWSWFAMKDI